MKNLVIAKRVVSNESEMYIVYVKSDEQTVMERLLFTSRVKAMKYAFILKKKHDAIITKAAMAILRKPLEQTDGESAPAAEPAGDTAKEAVLQALEDLKAETEEIKEEAVAETPAPKKRGRKPAAKKSNAEAL